MGFEIIEEITRADFAFRIYGKDLNELFISGAEALLSVMLENTDSLVFKIEKKIESVNSEIDLLLYEFLQELIYIKDSESLFLLPKSIDFSNSENGLKLVCNLYGEEIDSAKHILGQDVKAVTMHNLHAEKTESAWSATFVLDV